MSKPNSKNTQTDNSKAPVHRIRSGAISASIFKKTGENGDWYSVDVQRCYKGSDDQFHYTSNFGRDEALVASKLLDLSHTWIMRQEAKSKSAGQEGEA